MKAAFVSRKKKKPAPAPPPPAVADPLQDEERGSVAITVAWMLATLACVMSETVWLVGEVWIRATSDDPARHPLIVIPDMMRLIALCTGILALVLLPFVLRVRKSPPPRAITIFSLVVACLPLAAMLFRLAFPA